MANRVPIIDTGIVDPSMPRSTDINCVGENAAISVKGVQSCQKVKMRYHVVVAAFRLVDH